MVGCARKSYLGPVVSAVVLAKAISMTHSGMLYLQDISTFYFYEPLLFQLFAPWKFRKA